MFKNPLGTSVEGDLFELPLAASSGEMGWPPGTQGGEGNELSDKLLEKMCLLGMQLKLEGCELCKFYLTNKPIE